MNDEDHIFISGIIFQKINLFNFFTFINSSVFCFCCCCSALDFLSLFFWFLVLQKRECKLFLLVSFFLLCFLPGFQKQCTHTHTHNWFLYSSRIKILVVYVFLSLYVWHVFSTDAIIVIRNDGIYWFFLFLLYVFVVYHMYKWMSYKSLLWMEIVQQTNFLFCLWDSISWCLLCFVAFIGKYPLFFINLFFFWIFFLFYCFFVVFCTIRFNNVVRWCMVMSIVFLSFTVFLFLCFLSISFFLSFVIHSLFLIKFWRICFYNFIGSICTICNNFG